jgi:RHS repeat-associated protein
LGVGEGLDHLEDGALVGGGEVFDLLEALEQAGPRTLLSRAITRRSYYPSGRLACEHQLIKRWGALDTSSGSGSSVPTNSRPGFTGAPAEASGLVFLRNRFYDPNTGSFSQEDPIGFAGGINLYAYAGSNPVSYGDPYGLCPKDAGGDGKTDSYADCPEGSSGSYANNAANGHGGLANDIRGAAASCRESTGCAATAVAGAVVTGAIAIRAVAAGVEALATSQVATAASAAITTAATVGPRFIGNAISGFTGHGIDQVINRGVTPGALLDAARNGQTVGPLVDQLGRESLRIIGQGATFAINLLGQVTTAWRNR